MRLFDKLLYMVAVAFALLLLVSLFVIDPIISFGWGVLALAASVIGFVGVFARIHTRFDMVSYSKIKLLAELGKVIFWTVVSILLMLLGISEITKFITLLLQS